MITMTLDKYSRDLRDAHDAGLRCDYCGKVLGYGVPVDLYGGDSGAHAACREERREEIARLVGR